MSLPNELISAFAKITNDKKESNSESTVYGVTIEEDGVKYVRIDGSDVLTPAYFTAEANNGDRVTVLIKNHTATVTGNLTSPSASVVSLGQLDDKVSKNLYVRLTKDGLLIGIEGANNGILISEDAVNVFANQDTYSKFAANFVQFGNYQIRKSADGGIVFKLETKTEGD